MFVQLFRACLSLDMHLAYSSCTSCLALSHMASVASVRCKALQNTEPVTPCCYSTPNPPLYRYISFSFLILNPKPSYTMTRFTPSILNPEPNYLFIGYTFFDNDPVWFADVLAYLRQGREVPIFEGFAPPIVPNSRGLPYSLSSFATLAPFTSEKRTKHNERAAAQMDFVH